MRGVWIALVAVAVAVVLLQSDEETSAGGEHRVIVLGPESELWNGTVSLPPNATVYDALVATGIDYRHRDSPLLQPCGIYVYEVAGFEEERGAGWIAALRSSPHDDWRFLHRATCAVLVPDGDTVLWAWSEDGSEYQ